MILRTSRKAKIGVDPSAIFCHGVSIYATWQFGTVSPMSKNLEICFFCHPMCFVYFV